MLERLDSVPWAELEHAYGSAEDVPGLLRKLLNPDPAVRSETIWTLYGNVFHQGTRYPATPYVIPFLIELCESSETPGRGNLLNYWKSLITGYFTVQERPIWGDGEKIYWGDEIQQVDGDDPYSEALHQIYRESLNGHDLLISLLDDSDPSIRAGSAGVLACLSTVAECQRLIWWPRCLRNLSAGFVRPLLSHWVNWELRRHSVESWLKTQVLKPDVWRPANWRVSVLILCSSNHCSNSLRSLLKAMTQSQALAENQLEMPQMQSRGCRRI